MGRVTILKTAEARRSLALLSAARFGYPASKMITIGVTGTKGKTTTTHMIKAILEAAGKKVGMIGTTGTVINGQVTPTMNTTPESYELHQSFAKMAEAGCQYMIMEVSSQESRCTGWTASPLITAFSPIYPRTTSGRMSTLILRNISAANHVF